MGLVRPVLMFLVCPGVGRDHREGVFLSLLDALVQVVVDIHQHHIPVLYATLAQLLDGRAQGEPRISGQ